MRIAKCIKKTRLEHMYRTLKSKDVCKKLNISMPTLMNMLRASDIKLKGIGNRWPKAKYKVV